MYGMTDIFPEGCQQFRIEHPRSGMPNVALGYAQIGCRLSDAARLGLNGQVFLYTCDEFVVGHTVLQLFDALFRFHNTQDDSPFKRRAQTSALFCGKETPCLYLVRFDPVCQQYGAPHGAFRDGFSVIFPLQRQVRAMQKEAQTQTLPPEFVEQGRAQT